MAASRNSLNWAYGGIGPFSRASFNRSSWLVATMHGPTLQRRCLPQCSKYHICAGMTSTNDIRRSFLDYFERNGHARVPSAPLVPHNDPTLMFVNAGMVPFKNVFTGLETRPYSTAASSQKCVRAGGKHNDLDNVGYTARHHTFFEMLGNFSFGDYFKEQAIHHAWTLLTKEWGLVADRLTATVYHTDDEAFDLWKKIAGLPEEPHHPHPDQGQFLGDGRRRPVRSLLGNLLRSWRPYPRRPAGIARTRTATASSRSGTWCSCSSSRRRARSSRELPKKSIDTGMGLERVAAVLQGVHDNYDTDTFKALIAASEELTRTKAEGEQQASPPRHRRPPSRLGLPRRRRRAAGQ